MSHEPVHVTDAMLAAARGFALSEGGCAFEMSNEALAALYRRMHDASPEALADAPGAHTETTTKPLSLALVDPTTTLKTQSIVERAGYEVTGFVLTHRSRPAKAIVDSADAVRWIASEDVARLMLLKEPLTTTATPEGFEPPPEEVLEGDPAISELAMRLGCGYNASIPHNTGWFVPLQKDAYPTATDAVIALFTHIRNGGEVFAPTIATRSKSKSSIARTPSDSAGSDALAPLGATPMPLSPDIELKKLAAQAEPAPAQAGLF